MIIKMMKKRVAPVRHNGKVGISEEWHVYDEVSFYAEEKSDSKEEWSLRFVIGETVTVINPMDYDKIYIMNNDGKTIETIRSVDRRKTKVDQGESYIIMNGDGIEIRASKPNK